METKTEEKLDKAEAKTEKKVEKAHRKVDKAENKPEIPEETPIQEEESARAKKKREKKAKKELHWPVKVNMRFQDAYPMTTISSLEEIPTTEIGSYTTRTNITEYTRPAIEEKKEMLFIESLKALQVKEPEPVEPDIEQGHVEDGEEAHHHFSLHNLHFPKAHAGHPAEGQEGRKHAPGFGEGGGGPGTESTEDVDPHAKIQEYLTKLECTADGLTTGEAERRIGIYGSNSLPEVKESGILKFLGYMWNPLSWGMELAAIISLILVNWYDFVLISALLLLNASIGYWEERSSGNAIAALKEHLTPTAKVLRDGRINKDVRSEDLVPGDVALLRLGDVVPADMVLLEGENKDSKANFLKIDQSPLTGESLPVDKHPSDFVYSGSIIKQGEMHALVVATGVDTFFGRTASLISETRPMGHFQQVLRRIGWFCLAFIAVGVAIEIPIQFAVRGKPCSSVKECYTLNNAVVLLVGGIPIAMPTVLSVTMAIGAGQLAKRKAIVSRLTAVEQLAGMDILCSDKTGTLTKNELTVSDPIGYAGHTPEEVLLISSYASKEDSGDAIDVAIVNKLDAQQKATRDKSDTLYFHPFDPVIKKSYARIKTEGKIFVAAKGAVQILLNESVNAESIRSQVEEDTKRISKGGYRSLGVATSDKEDGGDWTFVGMIPLYDPPRDDTKETIKRTKELGVQIKMLTGDQLAIARETARLLEMGMSIYPSDALKGETWEGKQTAELIEEADGFAQVFPEHKYTIVERLQGRNHVIGMTGDGVNDAPALKRANIGIAVANATGAAQAASDIVLTSPGLSVIVDAIVGSRKIFQRMKNYSMYSITTCVRIVTTFLLLTVIFDFYFPTIAIAILAILNDGAMITVSKDRVKASPKPDAWNMHEIFGVAIALGSWLMLSTVIFYLLIDQTDMFYDWFGLRRLDYAERRGVIYLEVSLTGISTIFITRAHGFFFLDRPGTPVLVALVVAQAAASVLGAYGLAGFPSDGVFDFSGGGWGWVLATWVWSILWFLPMDFIKFGVRKAFSNPKFFLHPRKTIQEARERKAQEKERKMKEEEEAIANPEASPPPSRPKEKLEEAKKKEEYV